MIKEPPSFENHSVGFYQFQKILQAKGYFIQDTTLLNKSRHMLIRAMKNGQLETFYCLFKHEFFHSFNLQFAHYIKLNPERAGQGESINIEYCKKAIEHDAILIYIYPDKRIYKIYPKFIDLYCKKNNLIRQQNKSNEYLKKDYTKEKEPIQEEEYVFPVSFLMRWE